MLVERSPNVFRTLPTIDFLRENPVYKPENPSLSLLALYIYDGHVSKDDGNIQLDIMSSFKQSVSRVRKYTATRRLKCNMSLVHYGFLMVIKWEGDEKKYYR